MAAGKVSKTKNPRLMSKMGKFKAIISDMGDKIQNSLLRVDGSISGCVGYKIDFGNLKEIKKLFHIEGDFGNLQKERDNLKIPKMRMILTKKG